MQIDTNKTLRQLYEEGVIGIGTKLYMEVPKGREYVSKKELNGFKEQKFISDKIEEHYWEIALELKNNEIFVIGESFDNFRLLGAEGYVYGTEELNKICDKMFTTDYLKARSINIDDVNKVLGVEIIDNKVVQKEISSNTDISFFNHLGIKHRYGRREVSPESFLKKQSKKTKKKVECTAYSYHEQSIKGKELEKSLIFKENLNYWLASRGICLKNKKEKYPILFMEVSWDDISVDFGIGSIIDDKIVNSAREVLLNSNYDFSCGKLAIRPVGNLKSNIPIKDLPISEIRKKSIIKLS